MSEKMFSPDYINKMFPNVMGTPVNVFTKKKQEVFIQEKQKRHELKEELYCECGKKLKLVHIYMRGYHSKHAVWCPDCNTTDQISDKLVIEK